jgi:hypothetical protein
LNGVRPVLLELVIAKLSVLPVESMKLYYDSTYIVKNLIVSITLATSVLCDNLCSEHDNTAYIHQHLTYADLALLCLQTENAHQLVALVHAQLTLALFADVSATLAVLDTLM